MLFANKERYGVTGNIFLNQSYIGYLNLCKVKTRLGVSIGDATSRDANKLVCIKKCYSEYMERFALGIYIDKEESVQSINIIDNTIGNRPRKMFAYGDTLFGHNDTTGTATGINSCIIIEKAVCELIEKNDTLCFWYNDSGKVISLSELRYQKISECNFISNEFYCFMVEEISNYPTVIIMCFRDNKLLATGVSCNRTLEEAFDGAIQEAKIMEWQQFDNSLSTFSKLSTLEHEAIYCETVRKTQKMKSIIENVNEKTNAKIELKKWIKNIEINVIFADEKRGLKTIKCVSKELISSIPVMENIALYKNKEIVRRYYKEGIIDCPIV